MILSQTLLSKIINQGLSEGADFCEVYAEETQAYNINLEDSKTTCLSGKDKGVGIRLFYGNEELYTYTNRMDEESLLAAVKKLSLLHKRNAQKPLLNDEPFREPFIYEFPEHYKDPDLEFKKNILQKLDRDLRQSNSLITQCFLSINGKNRQVQIANSEGVMAFEHRPYHKFGCVSVVEDQGEKERGSERVGMSGFQEFFAEDFLRELSLTSGKKAIQNLRADKAPAGMFPVVINKGFGGVIFHEACGHGLETTTVAEKKSVFSDKLGKKIADSCVSAYDDGGIEGAYGSINIDDEGMQTQKTKLIDKGVLTSYMVDKIGSQKTNYKQTGSARRQSYKFAPTSRMRNTYIGAGDSTLEEMIKDVEFGLFAEKLGGGSVDPTTGKYNFAVETGRIIKNGKLDKAVKGASLIGNGLETLSKIKKVGKDLELAAGTCGSVSGWVPVTVGQPPILVSELTVGGWSDQSDSNNMQ